jgi:hypothetical protein
MKNTKRKRTKNQKGGFFTIGGSETKSQRDLIVKCDLTDVNSINDPFLMKDKINMCCPSSTFSVFAKNKSIKCNDMKKRYEELLKQNRQQHLDVNNVRNPRELEKMYLASCPKDRFGFKNSSRLCKELDARHRQLVLQDNKEIRQFQNEYGKPSTSHRLSNFGKNMINTFNTSRFNTSNQKNIQNPKIEELQNDSNNENYNSEFKSVSNKESYTEPEAPTQQEEEIQSPPETPSTETKTGGKRIKRKSKKITKKRRNIKTRRH